MESAIRESYAPAAERLAELARTEQPAAVAATADELLAVADLLGAQPALRRALSDPARRGEDRAALLRDLLGARVGAAATELVAALVAGRWPSGAALRDAVERLGVDAVLASAESAGELAEVEDELFRFGQVVRGAPQLAAALGDASAPVPRRAELVRALLAGKARSATVRLAVLAVAGFGGRGFVAGLSRLVELAAERRERQVAYVTVASALSEADERRLGDALRQLYGREVSVKLTVDPEVLGGMSVRVGSDLYDGTVARRLTDIRNALARR
ncbi:MAG TPA: F0F1 ATP synthase subunit delta [Pilimelia sp.]|nr:F0F1 ATP synthase subunit delta [Pilimelia sp.]